MTPAADPPDPAAGATGRLESWKEIAAYLRRDVTTVQRWERRERMPVHRHLHDKSGSVYAFRDELDAWQRNRGGQPAAAPDGPVSSENRAGVRRNWARWVLVVCSLALLGVVAVIYTRERDRPSAQRALDGARFLRLTTFGGNEHAAAVSRDGRFVAFLSNRDGAMDVWITQIGTGQFYNLTKGSVRDLVNPSVRTLGFTPDGAHAAFWARTARPSAPASIDIWVVPVLGGGARPYLENTAEFDWSRDGSRLVYHTPGPGDPMYVRDVGQDAKRIFSAPAGLHAHFPLWSPDDAAIYFVQGSLPDRMDIFRVRPDGGTPERLTHHDADVSHPVFLDSRTLLYLAGDKDGSGPWLHSLDLNELTPHRVSSGVERYTSLAASDDGRRIAATVARTESSLWRGAIEARPIDSSALQRLALTTGSGSSPRLHGDILLYVSPKGDGDSIWKVAGSGAIELWSAPGSRIIGAPAIAPDGARVAFSVREAQRTSLWVSNADGTDARVVTQALEPTGSPAWRPDGKALTVAAMSKGFPQLFNVPLDGAAPAPFVGEHAVDPMWSPSGDVVVYSGPDVGTTFPLKAAGTDGTSRRLPALQLNRGSRHVAFINNGRTLVFLRGELRHKNVWSIDLDTGAERQLTNFGPDFDVREFDISSDGRELILEQVRELSDIVLIEVPRRPSR